jgi:ElaA protein
MQTTTQVFTFGQLSNHLLYEYLKLRTDVFVVEQKCPYPELDNYDLDAFHLLLLNSDNKIVACARIFDQNIKYKGFVSIGRIATHIDFRNLNIGKQLVAQSIEFCHKQFGNFPIKIASQYRLLRFYMSFGFVPQGSVFMEDDIEHIIMVLPSAS